MRLINKTLVGIQIWFSNLMRKENGDVNIVSIVVLIGIAVLLAIIFREQIEALITTLLNKITTDAEDAITRN